MKKSFCENTRETPNLGKIAGEFEGKTGRIHQNLTALTIDRLAKNSLSRKDVSTQDALAYLTAKIYNSLDLSGPCLAIFVDLTKAFDCVNHEDLLEMLERNGIRGHPLGWFRSYLRERGQRVRIESEITSDQKVNCGVPQETVLGPILFILYINDIFSLTSKGDVISFADDTAVFYCDETWTQLKKNVETEFTIFLEFFETILLTINKDKTKFIPFSNYVTCLPPYNVLKIQSFNQEFEINSAPHMRYLRAQLDPHIR